MAGTGEGGTAQRHRPIHARKYAGLLAVTWTALVVAALFYNVNTYRAGIVESARIDARSAFQRDISYRRRAAGHGGVYVPVSEDTPPNPYLANLPNRDVTTESGMKMTLVNPAYMTRQVHEIAAAGGRYLAHITSLEPIRPENAADPWEKVSLRRLEGGAKEVSSLEMMAGREHLRLMRPLLTEKVCLKCHGDQGYRVGDLRGGISVSVDMAPYRALEKTHVSAVSLGYLAVWLLGTVGLTAGTRRIERHVGERDQAWAELEQRVGERTEELSQANLRLRELDRLKSMFIASMSHELRTPLNAVIGFTGVMLKGMTGEINEEQKKQLTMVKKSGRHLLDLINDIIDISKIEAGQIEIGRDRMDLSELVTDVVDGFMVIAAEKKLELLCLAPEVIPVASDERRIRQVVINLVSNAVKFTEHGRVEIRTDTDGDRASVRVKDTGPGISEADQALLFSPFGRLKRRGVEMEGTGLGLYLCMKIADLLGGGVSVRSTPGEGSEFTFSFPRGDG